MADEKAIVIDAKIWKEKYIPLEQYNEKLRHELAELKASKRIKVHCVVDHSYEHSYSIDIGHVDVKVDGTATLDLYGVSVKNSIEQIEHYIENSFYSPFHSHRIITIDQAKDFIKEIKATAEMVEEIERKKVLEWRKYVDKVGKIPRIVRWLFGIKLENLK